MQWMLDTDICSYLIRRQDWQLLVKMHEQVEVGAGICISVVTYAELQLGAARSGSPARHKQGITALRSRLSAVLAWGMSAADEFVRIQAELLRRGTPIGVNDAMIAAHAASIDCTLVTNNERHFGRVVGLRTDNWIGE